MRGFVNDDPREKDEKEENNREVKAAGKDRQNFLNMQTELPAQPGQHEQRHYKAGNSRQQSR
jgi:hypothetical protein